MIGKDIAVLPLLLKELRLSTMQRLWEELSNKALSEGWSPIHYLSTLCEYEVTERRQRKLKRRMSEAKLPKSKSLETYDYSTYGLNKNKILGLSSGNLWIDSGKNLLIFGPSGVGKTHLAAAIGEKLIENGFRVLFIRTTELVQRLQAGKQALTLSSVLDKYDKFDCLIMDDFGYVNKNECETSVLFELICERYERKSILLTCNQGFNDWDHIFANKQMAVAAIDRLVHHSDILEIEGESYRRREALKKQRSIKSN